MRLVALFAPLLLASGLLAQAPNKLTPEEAADGWLLLWDGRTEFGWEWHGDAV